MKLLLLQTLKGCKQNQRCRVYVSRRSRRHVSCMLYSLRSCIYDYDPLRLTLALKAMVDNYSVSKETVFSIMTNNISRLSVTSSYRGRSNLTRTRNNAALAPVGKCHGFHNVVVVVTGCSSNVVKWIQSCCTASDKASHVSLYSIFQYVKRYCSR
jgi:hypothetical protein